MNVIPTRLPGVVLIEPQVFADARGYFLETWSQVRYAAAGLPARFVQDNLSFSTPGVLRGLHLQNPAPQGKLVSVLRGAIYDVAIDVRVGSPTFGQWVGAALSAENRRQIYIPEGFAHGFAVTGDCALTLYKSTEFYAPQGDMSLLWSDPDLGIDWPVDDPKLSAKDHDAPRLRDVPRERLPRYEATA